MSKHYVALNRHALRAKIAGLATEGRTLRAPLRRPKPEALAAAKGQPSAPGQSGHRLVQGPDRVWLIGEAAHVGQSARWHLLAYAYLYRHGFACAESSATTRTEISEAQLTPIVLHYFHLDRPTFPWDLEGGYAAQKAEHERRKIAYDAELATFKADLAAAIAMTNKRISDTREAWIRTESERADRRAARRAAPRVARQAAG